MDNILDVIDTHLAQACDNLEAGFYFEEGGCFGMALELHSALCAAGIDAHLAVYETLSHALVVVGDDRYDYQGLMLNTAAPVKKVDPEQFLVAAHAAGHTPEDLFAAQEYARNALKVAFDLSSDLRADDQEQANTGTMAIMAATSGDYPAYQVEFNYASDRGNLKQMVTALDRGANIDEQDNVGRSPLALAINFGRWAIVDMLLSRGANPDVAEMSGFTALHRLIESMVSHKVADLIRLDLLLKAGASVDAADTSGKTALHLGAAFGCPQEALGMLLDHGANIDARDNLGRTALHHAAREGAADLIGWLLERGASQDTVDNDGKTPKQVATTDGLAAFDAWHAKQAVARVINESILARTRAHL